MSTMVHTFNIQCLQSVIWLFSRAQHSHDRSAHSSDANAICSPDLQPYETCFYPIKKLAFFQPSMSLTLNRPEQAF